MDKKNEPMDTTLYEEKFPVPKENRKRVCWALKTLVSEIHEVFPETLNAVEYSDYDGRGAALTATIDLTVFDPDDTALFIQLMELVGGDSRIYEVVTDEEVVALAVTLQSSPRTQDLRTTFNVPATWLILALEGSE